MRCLLFNTYGSKTAKKTDFGKGEIFLPVFDEPNSNYKN